jgi:phosphogluconate dehydratase
MNKIIQTVTEDIIQRSKAYRDIYLDRLDNAMQKGVNRQVLGCSNLVHGFAACSSGDKALLFDEITRLTASALAQHKHCAS